MREGALSSRRLPTCTPTSTKDTPVRGARIPSDPCRVPTPRQRRTRPFGASRMCTGAWISVFAAHVRSPPCDPHRTFRSSGLFPGPAGPHPVRRDLEPCLADAHGTSALRTHLINISEKQVALTWPVFAALRERWRGRVELQGVSLQVLSFYRDRETAARHADIVARHGGILG